MGRIHEVLLCRDGSRVSGLVLQTGSWMTPRRVLDYQAVQAIGETHVLAKAVFLQAESDTCCADELQGLPVLRNTGEELGAFDDFQFEPSTGQIVALLLSNGLVDDLLSGKQVVSVTGPVTTGQAAILLGDPGELSGGVFS
jgi:uncharacterized protein YrrD